MLPEIKKVRDEAIKCREAGRVVDLQIIANIFEMYSPVHEVQYIGYNVPSTNPIWGRFTKWEAIEAYSKKVHCKVQYATHLSEVWRLFVVCKELCHSLYTSNGSHSVANASVVNLVNSLALASASQNVQPTDPFMAERLAEFGALEILVPVGVRQSMLLSGEYNNSNLTQLSAKLNCPDYYIRYIFSQPVIDFSLAVLS